MSLKLRILAGSLIIGLLTLLLSWLALNRITDDIALRWATETLEHETSNEIYRATRPIVEELDRINRLASSQEILQWSQDPSSPETEVAAIRLLNNSAKSLIAGSYFVALKNNNHYYSNNADGEFTGKEYRYTLDPKNRLDGWFYTSLNDTHPYNLNVDFDRGIRKLKLWINVQIRSGDEVLGMIGTGFEISSVLAPYLEGNQLNYTAFFLDKDAAIQISSARVGLEMGSVAKAADEKTSFYHYLTSEKDQEALRAVLANLHGKPNLTTSLMLDWQQTQHIFGVSYLAELDWFLLLAIPPNQLISSSDFLPIYQVSILGVVLLVAAIYLLLVLEVDKPLARLKERIEILRDQKSMPSSAQDNLPSEFKKLSQSLDSFALYDPLTGLYNKRGLNIHLKRDLEHCARTKQSICVIVFDLDHFKRINDTYGHSIGDKVLKLTAECITNRFKRATDSVARFGGEEFVVTLVDCEASLARNLVENVRSDIRQQVLEFGSIEIARGITISAGAVLLEPDAVGNYTSQGIFDIADTLLYEAKATRDRACWRVIDV